MLSRLRNTSVADDTLRALADYIVQSNVQVGQRLPAERIVAEQLGVSRPILREALGRWAALGVIETRNGSGSYLRRPITPSDRFVVFSVPDEQANLLNLLELRRALETEAAALAAMRRTDADLALLQRCYDQADRIQGKGGSDPNSDWAFHMAVYAACHNPYFEQVVGALRDSFHRFFEFPLQKRDFANRSWPLHGELLGAIQAQDAARARECAGAILDIVAEELRS